MMDGHHHGRAVDARAEQHGMKRDAHPGRVDRSVRAAAAGQVAHAVIGSQAVGSNTTRAPRRSSTARRSGEGSKTMTSTPRRLRVRNTPMPMGPAPWMAAVWPDSSSAAIGRVPCHRQRLDQCALQRRHAPRQAMRHRAAHDSVFGQPAAAAVVAVQRDQRAMIVLPCLAPDATSAALERIHGDQIAERQILDAVAPAPRLPRTAHGPR